VLFFEPRLASFAVAKIKPGTSSSFLSNLDAIWKSMDSPYSLSYSILDEQLRENPSILVFVDLLKVLGLVAAFTIFISCLGLLGLAMYSAENRIKEIGIRKVLGASVNQLVLTLSKEYLWMILIAIAISTPLTWLLNSLWLNLISNKATFGFMIYASGAVIAALLAMFTISTQTFKAAKTNPVSNLQSE
jgi:putative ABC transport system permease protein